MIKRSRFSKFKEERTATPTKIANNIDYPKYENRVIDVPDHVKFWWKEIEENDSIFIESARGHFKSRSIAVIYSLYLLVKEPNSRIVLASETISQTQKWVKEIQSNIEAPSSPYSYLKPEKPKVWNKTEMVVNRDMSSGDPSITASGVGKAILSSRADYLIIDDICSKKNSRTPVQRKKVIDWYRETAVPILMPGGTTIIIGTPKHEEDLYAELRDDPDIRYLRFPAEKPPEAELEPYHENFYDNDDRVLWPEVWNRERLNERRNKMGSVAYAREIQLDLSEAEGGIVDPEWITYYGTLPKDKDAYRWAMGVDPSTGEKELNDYTGIVVTARDTDNGDIFVVYADMGHWKPNERLRKIETIYESYPISKIGIEDVSTTKDFINMVESETMLPIERLSTMGRDKTSRLETLTPKIENQTIKFKRALDKSEVPLINQLIEFHPDSGRHDDLVDAFVYSCWVYKEKYSGRIFEFYER